MNGTEKMDLVSMGQVLLRLSPPGYGRVMNCRDLEVQVGGAELNVAAGAAALGLRTGIISKIPSHDAGQLIKHTIASYGVDEGLLVSDPSLEARVGIYYYEYGAYPRKPKVIYDRLGTSFNTLTIEEIPEDIFRKVRCFHTSGITLALDKSIRHLTLDMIRRFKKSGTVISFDVNFRANLWSGEEARKAIEEILPYVDVFFCSEDTARLTFQKTGTIKDIMADFTETFGISVVASTRRTVHSPRQHTFGSVIYDGRKKEFFEEEPYRNIDVIDRIGSGDAYIAGVLYGLISSEMDCRKALVYGNAVSAMKNTISGDLLMAEKKEVDVIIKDHNSSGWHSEMER